MDDLIMYFAMWVSAGLVGSRLIHCLWFSGGLRDLRQDRLPIPEVILGIIFGPFSLIVAILFWMAGIGRVRD